MIAGLAAVAEHVIIDRLVTKNVPFAHKSKAGLALMLLSGLLLFVGSLFIIFGLHVWLQTRYEDDIALFITGGAVILFAGGLGVIGFELIKMRRHKAPALTQDIQDNIKAVIESLGQDLEGPIKDNPKMAMALAALAGFAVSSRMH